MFLRLAACLLLAGCASLGPAPARTGAHLLDTTAIEPYWKIQDALVRGDTVEEADWETLFKTDAYVWQAGTEEIRQRIRARMELAFQPDPGPLETKLAEAEGYDVIRWDHYRRIRNERNGLEGTLEALRGTSLIGDAIDLACRFVPAGAVDPDQVTTRVHLLFFAPDAFADDGSIYLDLVHAKDRGEGLVRLLAHEFHHELYALLSPFPELPEEDESYWMVETLAKLQLEGLADRIDKVRAPLTATPGLPPSYIEQFNEHYAAAPATLARLDEALVRYAAAENRAEVSREAWRLLHLGGHPEGFFLANTIAEAQGQAALLEDVGDPFAFLRRFQSVRPLFSDEALAVLAELEAELRAAR